MASPTMPETGARSGPSASRITAAAGRIQVDESGHVWRILADPPTARAARTAVDLRMLIPALAGWAAAAAALGMPGGRRLGVGVAAFVLGALLGWLGRPRHVRGGPAARLLALSALAIGVTLSAAGTADVIRRAGPVDELAARAGVARVTALVVGEPIDVGGGRVLVRVRLEGLVAGSTRWSSRASILVVGDERWADVVWHQRVTAVLRLTPARPADAVLAMGKPLSEPVVSEQSSWAARVSARVRSDLRAAVAVLPEDPRGLVPAMVFGDTSRSPPKLTDDMRSSGLAHLSAVSGANVSILIAAVLPLLRLLGLRRRWRPVVLVAVLAGFVLITRPEPSVIRAAVMGGVGVLALYRSTAAAGLPALAVAILVLLVFDPWLARSPGFALSALATLGLLVFAGPWSRALAQRLPGRSRAVSVAVVVPVAAMSLTAPVLVVLQGELGVVGIPANVLAAPFVAPVTIAGLVLAGLASLGVPTGWLAWLPGLPALAIAEIAHRGAGFAGLNPQWPQGGAGAALLVAVTVALLLTIPRIGYAVRRRPRFAFAVAALTGAGLLPVTALSWPPPSWQLVACDVGQGDALVLGTAPGHAVLVDAGPDVRAVDHCLRRLGVRVLDLVVLTHFHADHVDGLSGAVRGRPVGAILVSPVDEPADRAGTVAGLARAHGIPLRVARAGELLVIGAAELRVLAPLRRIDAGSVPNNASIVLSGRIGELDILLTGDIEAEAGAAVRAQLAPDLRTLEGQLAYDVVKAPHHGSGNLDRELMRATRAPLTLVSVGADNDYGHPAPSMLALAREVGTWVARTDELGDIAVWMADGRLYVRAGQR